MLLFWWLPLLWLVSWSSLNLLSTYPKYLLVHRHAAVPGTRRQPTQSQTLIPLSSGGSIHSRVMSTGSGPLPVSFVIPCASTPLEVILVERYPLPTSVMLPRRTNLVPQRRNESKCPCYPLLVLNMVIIRVELILTGFDMQMHQRCPYMKKQWYYVQMGSNYRTLLDCHWGSGLEGGIHRLLIGTLRTEAAEVWIEGCNWLSSLSLRMSEGSVMGL